MAGVSTPRHADSIDDVSAHYSSRNQKRRKSHPDEHDCTIHQALLGVQLQNAQLFIIFRQILYNPQYSLITITITTTTTTTTTTTRTITTTTIFLYHVDLKLAVVTLFIRYVRQSTHLPKVAVRSTYVR